MSENEERESSFEGKWYEYPLMRKALLSGLLTGTTFVPAHLKVIPPFIEVLPVCNRPGVIVPLKTPASY